MIVACGQMQAHTLAESAGVWPVIERLAQRATSAGVDLLVLPEATYPAYWLGSREEYDAAQLLDHQTVLDRLGTIARVGGFWLVTGYVEASGGALFNSAVVIDRTGRVVGVARKSFLWDCDNRWFAAADQLTVFDTEFGRMGVLICADGRAPEITATLAARGAAFMVMPTAWVNAARGTGRMENPQAEYLIRARAREFAAPFVCANKSGRESDKLEYVGQSQIVDAHGALTAIAPIEGEHLLIGELTPHRATPATVSEREKEILQRAFAPGGRAAIGPHVELESSMTADVIAAIVQRVGGRASRLSPDALLSFVPARCAALAGAQVLLVNGAMSDETFARARAMENRVFVVMADLNGLDTVILPTGRVDWRRGGAQPVIRLNLGEADDKHVTRETDIWQQRRVASYQF